jgi:tetratricopeptide (TPR) repeat protein
VLLGQFDDALVHFNAARAMSPSSANYLNVALGQMLSRRYADALASLRKASDDGSSSSASMAVCMWHLGQFDEAHDALRNSIRLAQTDWQYFWCAVATAAVGDSGEASKLFARALSIRLERPFSDMTPAEFIDAAPAGLRGCLRYPFAGPLVGAVEEALEDIDLPPELANAPVDDEPETPEEAAAVAEARAEVARGETLTNAELLRSLDL